QGQDLPQDCGKLRETQLHNEMEITAPDEYTWIGRVGYGESTDPDTKFLCLAVLIHQRFAILPAHCVLVEDNTTAEFILFGDWRADSNFKTGDCLLERGSTTCSPPPQAVDMEQISVHPRFKVGEHDYDIALAKMAKDVELSEFVQPLCLPPARGIEGNHISRRLEMAGFTQEHSWNEARIENVAFRRKVSRHTTSLEFCISLTEALGKLNLSQNHLCGLEIEATNLMSGSPLMDVEVVEGKPRNFYLVGINTFGTVSGTASPIFIDGFMRILPFRNWILKNIEYAS
ncbi:hypothetical protein KR054_009073, partial [Drosophila jambulina]